MKYENLTVIKDCKYIVKMVIKPSSNNVLHVSTDKW